MTETLADLITSRFGLPTDTGRTSPASGIIAQLLSHRSHRSFSAEPIKEETLQIQLYLLCRYPLACGRNLGFGRVDRANGRRGRLSEDQLRECPVSTADIDPRQTSFLRKPIEKESSG